jgi:hypothetical protein
VIQTLGINNHRQIVGTVQDAINNGGGRGFSRDADCRLRRPITDPHRWQSLNAVPVFPTAALMTKYPV